MPCRRHTSAVDRPASCSFKIAMICSSEKRFLRMTFVSSMGRTLHQIGYPLRGRVSTHGGGWNMEDSTWLRAYGGKWIYTPGISRADSGIHTNQVCNTSGTNCIPQASLGPAPPGTCLFQTACAPGWVDRGQAGFIVPESNWCPFATGTNDAAGTNSWKWCHPTLCCNF